jgi:hypothetical protein
MFLNEVGQAEHTCETDRASGGTSTATPVDELIATEEVKADPDEGRTVKWNRDRPDKSARKLKDVEWPGHLELEAIQRDAPTHFRIARNKEGGNLIF